MSKNKKELEVAKRYLKYIEDGYGTKVCKEYNPDCINCQSQVHIGLIHKHIDLIKWSIKQDKKIEWSIKQNKKWAR